MPVSHFPPDSIIAEFLMANHPPGGWEQLSTKQDLKEYATKEDLKEFATRQDLEVGLRTVRAEMREGFCRCPSCSRWDGCAVGQDF